MRIGFAWPRPYSMLTVQNRIDLIDIILLTRLHLAHTFLAIRFLPKDKVWLMIFGWFQMTKKYIDIELLGIL